jgi:hypothetical protein
LDAWLPVSAPPSVAQARLGGAACLQQFETTSPLFSPTNLVPCSRVLTEPVTGIMLSTGFCGSERFRCFLSPRSDNAGRSSYLASIHQRPGPTTNGKPGGPDQRTVSGGSASPHAAPCGSPQQRPCYDQPDMRRPTESIEPLHRTAAHVSCATNDVTSHGPGKT